MRKDENIFLFDKFQVLKVRERKQLYFEIKILYVWSDKEMKISIIYFKKRQGRRVNFVVLEKYYVIGLEDLFVGFY